MQTFEWNEKKKKRKKRHEVGPTSIPDNSFGKTGKLYTLETCELTFSQDELKKIK